MAEASLTGESRTYGKQVNVPKAASLVADSLRKQIIRQQVAAGDILPSESALIEQFGVSRPTLREAIRVLESEQLVKVRRGARGGAVVQAPSADLAAHHAGLLLQFRGTTLADTYQARVVFEPTIARLVAENHSEEDLAELRAAVDREQQMIHEVHDLAAKVGFHRTLAQIAGNQTLLLLSELLRNILLSVADKESRAGGDQARAVEGHRELLEIIEAGDGRAAEEHWRAHLRSTTDRILAQLGDRTSILDIQD
jgi:DNA-binding FadR family transcriptional regulator